MADRPRERREATGADYREEKEISKAQPPVETQKHYEYSFYPLITDGDVADQMAEIVNGYVRSGEGGVKVQVMLAIEGPDGAAFSLHLPKHMLRSDVDKLFSRLNESGLVNINTSSENYTPDKVDERIKIHLKPGEQLVATVHVGADKTLIRAGWRVVDSAGNEQDFFSAPQNFGYAVSGAKIEIIDSISLMDSLSSLMGSVFQIEH